jgi:hypothetical protein
MLPPSCSGKSESRTGIAVLRHDTRTIAPSATPYFLASAPVSRRASRYRHSCSASLKNSSNFSPEMAQVDWVSSAVTEITSGADWLSSGSYGG